ncbi:MAG: antitoxin VapB family protein [Candidatus Bathyarchaeota archaeon]|nr:antitoxin VapB family protein [Candidatus Bathyarchaeota archaeon]
MPSKSIHITEEVYLLLTKMKLTGESFSDTIKRLAKRESVLDAAGLWKDVPKKEIDEFWAAIHDTRRKLSKSTRTRPNINH